ncbi:MAG: hypothetical protein KGJ57_18595 [Sphingomonadales bacterium]|nr:hypothetical protein [Sphingomonadales bacterium]MDE2171407.1 hypothetical protein [Sphingomonadales bacterium]
MIDKYPLGRQSRDPAAERDKAKPGRPPVDDPRRFVVTVRVTRASKDRMLAAAELNGRSLAQEAEHRIMETMIEEDQAGGLVDRALLKMVSALVAAAEARTGKAWSEDYATNRAVRLALDAYLAMHVSLPGSDELRDASLALHEADQSGDQDARQDALVELDHAHRSVDDANDRAEAIAGQMAQALSIRMMGPPNTVTIFPAPGSQESDGNG